MRRRRHDPPFSLFAFQDIITSVTGILLLMTLLITLALITRELGNPEIQSVAVAADVSAVLDETRSEISNLQTQFGTGREELAALADISASSVRRELHDLDQQIASLVIQVDSLEKKVDDTEQKRLRWKTKQSDLSKIRNLLQQMQRQLEQLKEQRKELEQEDRLIYNPQQSSGKHAWLVDVDQQNLLVARVGVSEAPRQFRGVADFLRWATSRDSNQEYFVLLVRPEGIDTYQRILVTLLESDYDLGVDLIGQDQTVIDPAHGAGDRK